MRSPFDLLRESEFFDGFDDSDLRALAHDAIRHVFQKGDRIVEEGLPSEKLYILVSGTIQLSFLATSEPNEMDPRIGTPPGSINIHTVNEPSSLIGWSAMVEPYRCRATATALETTRAIAFERHRIEAYCKRRPEFGMLFVRRILWALGDRLGTSRAQLVPKRDVRDARAVRELLAKRGARLGVNSPLYKIPVYLENRLTAADAFDILEKLARGSDPIERDVAVECRRLLGDSERESRIFRQLQRIYDSVAQAPDSKGPAEIRRTCCEEFRKLYALTDYRVEGWENLPPKPGFLVLMNHLSNHPESTLPNRFQLTLDTHFVSAMILYASYGEAPVRVVRQAAPDEIGHRRYFDRLGYITVTSAGPTGPDARTQLRRIRKQFLMDSCAVLAAGQNLVICPEGGSTKTRSSPMAFRAGAFRIARSADPEPLLLPIAVANFDRRIARRRLAAKIFSPIRLSEFVAASAPDAELYDFINNLRLRYRGFVKDARRLAAHPAGLGD